MTTETVPTPRARKRVSPQQLIPLAGRLRSYRRDQLRGDSLAALVVVATLIPQSLAYGELAGLPPEAGLWTALGAMVAYALFTRTRVVVVGPSMPIAIMTFTVIADRAGGDPRRAMALAACLSLMAGAFCLIGAALRWGDIADFLSEPVLLGYLAGSALHIISSQTGKLVGVHAEGEATLRRLWNTLTHLGDAHSLSAIVGVGSIAVLLFLGRRLHGVPASVVVVVSAIGVSAAVGLADRGVAVVGRVSTGLPVPALPVISAGDVLVLLPAAAGVALVAYSETVLAVRNRVVEGEEQTTADRELAALGTAGLAAGVLGGFHPTASDTRSSSAAAAGARTQVFQLLCAALVAGALLAGGFLISKLPIPVLAAIALVGAIKLFDVAGFRRLWKRWRSEAVIALVTMLGVAILGVLWGLLVAVALSLGELIRRTTRPHDAVLAFTAPDRPPQEIDPHQVPQPHPEVLIYRVDAPLFFANAHYVRERVLALAAERGPRLRYVILDAQAIFYLDATAADALARLATGLRVRGCRMLIARASDTVLATLRANPYEDGATRDLAAFPTVRDAFVATQVNPSSDPGGPGSPDSPRKGPGSRTPP